MNLVTFGGLPAGKTGCTAPASIHVSTVRVTGTRWYTSFGLRVGDSVVKLRRLYRRAQSTRGVPGWYGSGYWLVTERIACIGECGGKQWVTAPVLVGEVRNSRAARFVFVIGAQGE